MAGVLDAATTNHEVKLVAVHHSPPGMKQGAFPASGQDLPMSTILKKFCSSFVTTYGSKKREELIEMAPAICFNVEVANKRRGRIC